MLSVVGEGNAAYGFSLGCTYVHGGNVVCATVKSAKLSCRQVYIGTTATYTCKEAFVGIGAFRAGRCVKAVATTCLYTAVVIAVCIVGKDVAVALTLAYTPVGEAYGVCVRR